MKKNIAIIGAGIAGLTAGYLLNKKHNITIFEKSNRVGGNAYMINTPDGDEIDIAVAAFGKAGYGNFYALLDELNIGTDPCANTFMSFHNMDTKEGLYITPTLRSGFRQGFNLLKPKTMKSLYNLFTGIREANKLLDKNALSGLTMRECLEMIPQMKGDAELMFVCTLCLLSSMEYEEVLNTPASFFIKKLRVHNDVISPKFLYSVRAIKGGTKSYINALIDTFRDKVILKSKIKTIIRNKDRVVLMMDKGKKLKFDKVVFACNADQALALLEKPTKKEKELLGVWKYKEGKLVIHKDHSSFPSKDLIQAYTFLYSKKEDVLQTSVNGALWFEPYVSNDCDYISTQHPNYPIRADLIHFKTVLRTPMFSFESVKAIEKMPSLNGTMNSYYCGSHFGYGLHDDAVTSAITVAKHFGVEGPKTKGFKFEPSIKKIIKAAGKLRG